MTIGIMIGLLGIILLDYLKPLKVTKEDSKNIRLIRYNDNESKEENRVRIDLEIAELNLRRGALK